LHLDVAGDRLERLKIDRAQQLELIARRIVFDDVSQALPQRR